MSAADPHSGDASEVLAAELALGVLDGAERAEAERRAASDTDFAREVDAWRTRLGALTNETPSQPAPAALWPRIIQALGGDEDTVVILRLRRTAAVWRSATGAAAAIAAVLVAALVWPHPAPPSSPLLTARLAGTPASGSSASGTQQPAVFVALVDPVRHSIVLTPATISADPDRSPELWLIPAGGKPIALGVAAFERAVQFRPRIAPQGSGAVLAVSIEPRGGSPTGQPTGPVVATGTLEALRTS